LNETKTSSVGYLSYPTKRYLDWHDISSMFNCGRNKAILIMHKVGAVHVGKNLFVENYKVDEYLAKNGSIDIKWSTSRNKHRNRKINNE
jgi:hypothetical protein